MDSSHSFSLANQTHAVGLLNVPLSLSKCGPITWCKKNDLSVTLFIYLLRVPLLTNRSSHREWNGKFRTINNRSKSRRQSRNFVLKVSFRGIVTLTCANKSPATTLLPPPDEK